MDRSAVCAKLYFSSVQFLYSYLQISNHGILQKTWLFVNNCKNCSLSLQLFTNTHGILQKHGCL